MDPFPAADPNQTLAGGAATPRLGLSGDDLTKGASAVPGAAAAAAGASAEGAAAAAGGAPTGGIVSGAGAGALGAGGGGGGGALTGNNAGALGTGWAAPLPLHGASAENARSPGAAVHLIRHAALIPTPVPVRPTAAGATTGARNRSDDDKDTPPMPRVRAPRKTGVSAARGCIGEGEGRCSCTGCSFVGCSCTGCNYPGCSFVGCGFTG